MQIPIGYQSRGVGIQSVQYRQEVPDIQQPEVKYSFSSYESADVLPVTYCF